MVEDTLTSHIDNYRRFLTGLACCAVLVLLLRDSLFLNPFWGERRDVQLKCWAILTQWRLAEKMMPGAEAEYRYHIVSRPIRISREPEQMATNKVHGNQQRGESGDVRDVHSLNSVWPGLTHKCNCFILYRCLRVRVQVVLSIKVLIGSTKQTGPDHAASMRISAATIIYLTDADTVTTSGWGPTDGSELSRQS